LEQQRAFGAMGCNQSNERQALKYKGVSPPEPAKGVPKPSPTGERTEKLLDKYSLGQVLGQGAFGVVYSCKKKGTKEEYAVKMIDQVETPVAEIKQEVEMLRKLAHPCVVKLIDVYYEKVFVCMVLEVYKGGDMIEGMQHHWKSKGVIPVPVIQNLSKMMFQSIAWLHQNDVIHRDLKGDNFLQDSKDIDNPNCRVYLSDFGTVIDLKPGVRLKQRCGTKTYWAPEFFNMNYALPVDIWALGVTVYGIATGRFPFKGEEDVRNKTVKAPSRVGAQGEAFILGMLDRNEERRLTAKQALALPFLSKFTSAAEAEIEKLEENFKPEVKESGANAGIKERRRELVDRLEQHHGGGKQKQLRSTVKDMEVAFEVLDVRNNRASKFEWWDATKVNKAQLIDESKGVVLKDAEDAEWLSRDQGSADAIRGTLEDHRINIGNFGKGQAKKLVEFVLEVQSGLSRLMLDATKHKTLVRVVDVVLLRICFGQGVNKRYLIQTSEKFPDGRTRGPINQLIGMKKLPHENAMQTAERCMRERIAPLNGVVAFEFSSKETFEEDEESPSYPGVRTVYRKEIFEGYIILSDSKMLEKVGLGTKQGGQLVAEDSSKYTRNFSWMTEAQCEAKKIKVRAPKDGSDFSALVHAPCGYNEEELMKFLQANKVDISRFGANGVKSLAEFSEELVGGEANLTRVEDGRILRVVDVVLLKLRKANGDILVQVSETYAGAKPKDQKRLPGVKRRFDENPFLAAHRVLSEVLKINENLVRIDTKNVVLLEEEMKSSNYADLPTLYRKRIITANVYTK